MPLTILSQAQLRSLLLSLNRDEVSSLQQSLAQALLDYSTGSQEQGCAATYQPLRTAITRQNGCTTLFMPASTGRTIGMKMISLQDGGAAGCAVEGAFEIPEGTKTASRPRSAGPRSSMASLSSEMSDLSISSQEEGSTSSSSSRSLKSGTVNRQSVGSSSSSSVSKTLGAWPGAGTRDTSPQGTVTLLDADGMPFGLINAHELTPFRTALATMMIFNKRKRVRTVVVFGAGKQAYWHIRLALTLRAADIKRVVIVNRSFERAARLLKDIYSPENSSWRGDVKFSAVSTDFGEYDRIIHDAIHKSDAIFCCTPSIEPLFPAELLTSREGRRKGRFISAIGSYKPHMTELHPDILRDEVSAHHSGRHFHKHVNRSGVVVVDSLEAALKEAGELIQAGIKPNQAVELGELLMVRDASRKDNNQDGEDTKSLREWVERGNVIYKSVGMGLMDLVTGGDLVQMARTRNLGTSVEDF
ncbi:putative proline utilization protein PrnX-like [Aspergillus novofumigatus IBT 16806]|uniref:Putative proline utilization protein PrnX n=1 Tax=Aspergillus novofumigatus (strain IBT 16806) TaxID=1392255 RepID=A0A2I1BVW4_ASPN1|nr:putative proline utilization protein PrnX [Aspergillus novofumigatus IBT 16806]PKX89518.1 putative proline utilization protein PrnX [Aspergillus novofumigatus IBT 16806]